MYKIANLLGLKYILLLLCVCSCKNTAEKIDPSLEDKLVLSFDALVEVDDEFQLYFRKEDENFKETRSIKHDISGSNKYQTIQFVFNQLDFPQSIRLDMGMNTKQGPIKIKNIELKYNDHSHLFSIKELRKYFVANKYIDANFDELTFTPLVIDNDYDPFLTSFNISYFVNKLILY
jgi:hypothetical protein